MFLRRSDIVKIWKVYEGQDKYFFYNHLTNTYYLGICHIDEDKASKTSPTFYPMSFFKDADFEHLGLNKALKFKYNLVVKNNEVIYKDFDFNIDDVKISRSKSKFHIQDDDYKTFYNIFNTTMKNIKEKKVEKVVASRMVKFYFPKKVRVESIILRLLQKNMNSFIFAYERNNRVFLGATPEILVQKKDRRLTTYALAGTIAKTKDDNPMQLAKQLLEDEKNMHEHKIVLKEISQIVDKICGKIRIEETEILELKNLLHIKTRVVGERCPLDIVECAKLLHPTPAVCGYPVDAAMDIIKKCEEYERTMYAAPMGIIEANGDGIFIVALRSAFIENRSMFAFAGCGIVEKSIFEQEFAETTAKLQTIIESL